MKKMMHTGLLLYAAALVAQQFINVPEVIMGFTLGLAICFELLGVLMPEETGRKLRNWKRSLFKRRQP